LLCFDEKTVQNDGWENCRPTSCVAGFVFSSCWLSDYGENFWLLEVSRNFEFWSEKVKREAGR